MTFFFNITTANFKDKVKKVTRKKITFIDLFETAIFKRKIFHLKLHGLWCKIKNMTITRLRFERPRLENGNVYKSLEAMRDQCRRLLWRVEHKFRNYFLLLLCTSK